MKENNSGRRKTSKRKLYEVVPLFLPPRPEEWITVNPYAWPFLTTPINVMFPAGEPRAFYGLPAESYLNEVSNKGSFPPPLIDAINNENEIVLRINLNHKRQPIVKDFSRLLTIAYKELRKNNRRLLKVSDRDFSLYETVYDLYKMKKWTYLEIAEKIFPEEFKEQDPYSEDESVSIPNPESAVVRIKQIFKEAKKIIEGIEG